MNWLRSIAAVIALWSASAGAATLTWNANTESDLAGYRVYQCNLTPCSPGSGNQSLLVSLGKVTSFDIGTPSVTKYYYITAYDTANLESGASNVATFVPAGSQPPPPPPLKNVNLTVVGTPALAAWGVEGSTTDLRDVMATVFLDGKVYATDHTSPYSFPTTSGPTTTGKFGVGTHTVEFVFYLEGTTTEIGRANVTVQEGAPPSGTPPPPTVRLTVVGNPAAGAWGVEGVTTDMRDVMAKVYLDGTLHHVENTAPYGFPNDNGITATTGRFGSGSHTVQFIFYLQNSTTEIGRASVTVQEGAPNPVSVAVVGNPTSGAWGVVGSTTDKRDVMAKVYLDGNLHHVENNAPYGFPDDNGTTATTGRFGAGQHKVEFVFYLQNTTTEIGRASVTVQEGR
jgi:hypothetical protein